MFLLHDTLPEGSQIGSISIPIIIRVPHNVQRNACTPEPTKRPAPQSNLSAMATNVHTVEHKVSRSKRAQALGVDVKFRGCTIWFTGVAPLCFSCWGVCVSELDRQ